MNEQQVINNMIDFIEEKERSLQQQKLLADSKAKSSTIKAILKKLEEEINADQNN